MKDHEIAAVINELRDIAVHYGGTQQLRERISQCVTPHLKKMQDYKMALEKIRIRAHFIEWPSEDMWNLNSHAPDAPQVWHPDWRYELQLMENVLFGYAITAVEKPTDTKPRREVMEMQKPVVGLQAVHDQITIETLNERVMAIEAELNAVKDAAKQVDVDYCTDSNNCRRCQTHPDHRGNLEHAGIGKRPQVDSADVASANKSIPDDFYSHKSAWLNALTSCRDSAQCNADRSYWQHEINAFHRAYNELGAQK